MSITRRLLLGTAGVAAFGAVGYIGSRGVCRFVPRNHPNFFSLLEMVPQEPAPLRIGAAALAGGELPADLGALAERLGARPLIREALATDCPTTRRSLVQDQCATDFAEGRTMVVDGWVLSETEASLCAARRLATA